MKVYFGEDSPLDITIHPEPTTLVWDPATNLSCDDCLKPIVTATNRKHQLYPLTDDNGCPQSAEFQVIEVEGKDPVISLPNVISAPSRQVTTWVIQNGDGYKILGVDVYDR